MLLVSCGSFVHGIVHLLRSLRTCAKLFMALLMSPVCLWYTSSWSALTSSRYSMIWSSILFRISRAKARRSNSSTSRSACSSWHSHCNKVASERAVANALCLIHQHKAVVHADLSFLYPDLVSRRVLLLLKLLKITTSIPSIANIPSLNEMLRFLFQ